jgi:lipopolysaccharide/colanic/teichoic acid biosynthesis glycosyltransferase
VSGFYPIAKRAFDITAAIIGLVALLPVMVVIAAAVRVDSPGAVLYRAKRIGKDGKPFRMLKFRSMVADAELKGGSSTGERDARITRVGRYLRACKLDELPQLINVLRGEMSIVGPRPEVEEYTSQYVGDELRILSVAPGITDFASIEFRDLASQLGARDPDLVYARDIRPRKNSLRLQYVQERGVRTDLVILARTLQALFRRR